MYVAVVLVFRSDIVSILEIFKNKTKKNKETFLGVFLKQAENHLVIAKNLSSGVDATGRLEGKKKRRKGKNN